MTEIVIYIFRIDEASKGPQHFELIIENIEEAIEEAIAKQIKIDLTFL